MSEGGGESRQRQIAQIAADILAGVISPILGARRLNAIARGPELDQFLRGDPDFIPFVAVDSETDALPVDPEVRKLWAPAALEGLRDEIARAEQWARDTLAPHCERLIRRFGH